MLNLPKLNKVSPLIALLISVVTLSGCNSSNNNATKAIPDEQIKLKAKQTVYLQADDQISTCDEYAKKDLEDGGVGDVMTVYCEPGDATITFTVNMLTGERTARLSKGTAYIYRPVVNK